MNKFIVLFLLFITFIPKNAVSFGLSLDDMYRDIVRSENDGYLPTYISNKNTIDIQLDNNDVKKIEPPKINVKENKIVYLKNKRKEEKARLLAEKKEWEEIVNAAKNAKISPYHYTKIQNMVDNNNPKAVELLAWMKANGIGCSQDLVSSYYLYKKASRLKVKNASKNALLVYKSLPDTTRRQLSKFHN
jgi:hypothetical protein